MQNPEKGRQNALFEKALKGWLHTTRRLKINEIHCDDAK